MENVHLKPMGPQDLSSKTHKVKQLFDKSLTNVTDKIELIKFSQEKPNFTEALRTTISSSTNKTLQSSSLIKGAIQRMPSMKPSEGTVLEKQ